DGAAFLLLKIIEPCTWWIYHIASGAQQLPVSVNAASPVVVLLAYGWIIAGLVCGHPRKTFALLAASLVICGTNFQPSPQPLEVTKIHTVNTTEEIDEVPADTQDRKSTRLNSSHVSISYAVFCFNKNRNRCRE